MLCIFLALGFFAALIFSVAVPIKVGMRPNRLHSPLHQDPATPFTAGLDVNPINAPYNVTSLVAAPFREASIEFDAAVDDLWRAPSGEQSAADAVDLSDCSQGTCTQQLTGKMRVNIYDASCSMLA